MAKKLNWDRVHSEDLGRRRGYHDIGSNPPPPNPPPPNPPTPPKCNPPEPNPPKKQNQNHSSAKSKNECKVVQVEQISGYLGCNHSMLVTSLQHLARDSAAVEVTTGEWVLIQRMPAPPYTQPGKLVTIQPRNRKAEPTKFLDGAAQSIDHQTNAYQHQDAGDDGRAPW